MFINTSAFLTSSNCIFAGPDCPEKSTVDDALTSLRQTSSWSWVRALEKEQEKGGE